MTHQQCNSIFHFGEYLAYFTWLFLVLLMLFQMFSQNLKGLKITFLYALNSLSFFLAAGIVLKLALIVSFGRVETRKEHLEHLKNQCQEFLLDFILFSFIVVIVLAILNFLYLRYFVKIKPLQNMIILLVSTLSLLLIASYISVINFYNNFSH